MKTKLTADRASQEQQLEVASVKAWQRISLEETQHLEMSVGSRLQAVMECNRLPSKYEKTILMFTIMLVDTVTCEFLKIWGFVP